MRLFRNRILLIFIIAVFLTPSCVKQQGNDIIIVSRTSEPLTNLDFFTGDSWRYLSNSSLIAVDRSRPGKAPKLLTADFSSACTPSISYDGKKVLFAGKVKESEPWQIWELTLSSGKFRKVTQVDGDCVDPVYLPGERVVFSMRISDDTTGILHSLHTCNLDGTDTRQITFHPHADFAPAILSDGRILASTRQIYPDPGNPYFMVLRPDGTKADRFYHGPDNGGMILNRVCETSDGKILFVESGTGNRMRGDIYSLNLNRPLNSKINLTTKLKGSIYSLYLEPEGPMLVAYKPDVSGKYSLYEYDIEKNEPGHIVYSDSQYNVTGVVSVKPYTRPRNLPSEVDMLVKTGQIMCQDINILGPEKAENAMNTRSKSRKIEVLGINSSLGIVETEQDGSFYLKPLADKPFRIRSLDEHGNVVNGPSGWIWLRPNERRGCIGCHEDPELAPDNRLSLAVKKMPVIIPVHIDNIIEKSVELE